MLLQGNPLYRICILLKPIAYSCNLVQDTNCGVQPCGTCAVHALLIEKRLYHHEERRKGRGGVHLLLHHTSFARWRWVERGPNTFHSAQASRFHPSVDVFTLYLGSNRHFYSFFKKSFTKKKFFRKGKKTTANASTVGVHQPFGRNPLVPGHRNTRTWQDLPKFGR